jgi:hypothetical protein
MWASPSLLPIKKNCGIFDKLHMSHYISNVKLAEKFPSHVDSAATTQATKQDCDMVKKYEKKMVN